MSDEQKNTILEDPRLKHYAKIALRPEFAHATEDEKMKLRDTYFSRYFNDVKKTQDMINVLEAMKFVEYSVSTLNEYQGDISTGMESKRLVANDDIKKADVIKFGRPTDHDYMMKDYPSEMAHQRRKTGLEEKHKLTPEQEKTIIESLQKQQDAGILYAFGKGVTESTIPTFFDKNPYNNYVPTAFWGKGKGGFKGKEIAKDVSYMVGRVAADLPITLGFLGAARALGAGEILSSAVGFGGSSALNSVAQMEMLQKQRDMEYAQNVLNDFLIGSLAGGTGATFGQMTGQFAKRLMPNAGKALTGGGLLARVTAEGAIADAIDSSLKGIEMTPEERLLSIATGALTFGGIEAMNRSLKKSVDFASKYKDRPEGFSDAEISTQTGRVKFAEDAKVKFIEDVTTQIVDKSMARAKDPSTVYDVSRKKAVDAVFENPAIRKILSDNPEMESTIIGNIDEGIRSKLPHYVTGKKEKMAFNQVASAFFKSKEGRAPEMMTMRTKKGNEKAYSEADKYLPDASEKIVSEMIQRGEVIETKKYYQDIKDFRDYVTKISDLSEIYTDSIPAKHRPAPTEGALLYGQRIETKTVSPSYQKRLDIKQKHLTSSLKRIANKYMEDSNSFENRQRVESQLGTIEDIAEEITPTRLTKTERDIMTNILTLPKGVMDMIAPKINLFKWTGLERFIKPKLITNASQAIKRKMGKAVYDLYQAGRTFENVYYKHLTVFRIELKQMSEKYNIAEKTRAALFMLSRQKDGADIFANMKERERTGIYKLTEKFRLGKKVSLPDELPSFDSLTKSEKELVVYFTNKYKKFLDGVNKAREMMGYDKIPEIDGYYPLIRALSDAEDAGISYASTGDEIASWVMKNQFEKRAGIGKNTWFSKKRTGGNDFVLLDPFQGLDIYAQSAFKIMDIAPYAKKMQELGESIGKYNKEAGTFLIDTMKLFSGEFKDTTKFREILMKSANGLTVSYLGYNYNTILTQYSAHKNTIAEFGYWRTMQACTELAQDPKVIDFIYDRSQYMKTRRDSSFDATVNDIVQGYGEGTFDKIKQNSLVGMKTTDLITSEGAWWTAFKQYEKTNSPRQAALMADDFVVRSHASASKLDIAPIQKKALGKAITAFQTFVIANWNYLVSDVMGIDPIYKHYKTFTTADDAIAFVGKNKNQVIYKLDGGQGFVVYNKERTTDFVKASVQMGRLMMFNAIYNSAMQITEGVTGMATSAPGPDPIDAALEHYYGTKPGRLAAGAIPVDRRKEKDYLTPALWKGFLAAFKEAPVVGGIEYGGKGIGGAQLQLVQDMANSFSRGDFVKFAWQLSALKGNPFYNMYNKLEASTKKSEEQERRKIVQEKNRKKIKQPDKIRNVENRIKSINDRVNTRINR